MKPKAIGIHLGDFYSSVGTFEYTGVPDVIANDHGNLSTPSYVAFVGDQQVLVGEAAYDQANTNPKNTVFGVNRFIGRTFEDKIVQEQIENVPFSVVNVGGWPMIEVENRKYSSKEICSMTLSKLKQTAESYLANKVTEAVITVPDYFNDSQRKAVKDAASTVGLTVLRFISESETVAIAYELDKLKESERKNVLILELNHEKTLNASIVDCDNGLKVLASKSANIVKGEDNLTDKIVNWLLRKIQQVSIMATDPLEDHIYNDYLRCICKIAKRAFLNNLSFSLNSTEVFRYDYFDNYHHSYFSPREFKFSTIVMDTFKSTEQLISDVLENTTLNITDIDAVILVGQTTRVFEFDPFFITNFINHNVNIYESIPHDKVFAFGATVQAANMQNEYCTIDRFFRSDCTPLNIGIVLEGGIVCPVIERGTIIPTKKSKIINFSEYSSHIQIYEGQCQFFHDSFYIEKLYISLFRTETIEVTFEIDITGTLIVSANAYNQSIEITNVKRRRTRAEIELMWEYAEQHRVKNEYVRKIIGCLDKNVETIKLDFAFACSASEDADIELPKLLKSSVPQTLNIKIEKLLQEIRHEVANCEYNLVNYLPFNAVINSLTNARDILNRYSLTKNEFDSIFVNEQQVILEIFEQAVFWIRELMLDFLFEFYNIETNKELISSHSEIRIHIQDNVLLQMRSIQSLLILLVKVLWDKQTLFFECSSYFGMFQNPDTIKCKDTKFEIIESTLTSIQQTIETKAIKLLQALDASSVNSPQITKVVYILKNVLFNYGSDAKLGNITFTNDESVTKHGDVDVNKLDKALIEMKKILLELTATTTDIHSVVTGSSQETNAINDVLKQMREIEQLLKTKKFMQNKSSKLGKSSLKKEKVLKKERSSLSLISINEQNFNDAEIIEYFENSEKNETNSHSTDQQTITVDSIEEKYLSNSQSENECIENTKSFNEFNCIVISEESIAQCEIKRDDQTVLHETSLTQTIETAQIFEAIEQEIETNMTEHQQSEPTDDCLNQVETILETEQLLQQAPTSELSNQNKCCCCNLL